MSQCIIANESRILRHLIRRIVERRGLDAVEARDGPEVIDLFKHARPRFLCIDEALPDIDGVSVMRLMRAENAMEALPPTIFTYLENDQMLLARAIAAGATSLVPLPFTAAAFDRALTEVLT